MKIKIQRSEILGPLNKVSQAASNRNTLPILEGVLIETGENLRLTCSNSTLTITTIVNNYELIEPGAAVIPAKKLLEIVKKLPEKEILVEAHESSALIICGSKKIKLPLHPADEFPELTNISAKPINIDGEEFTSMVDSVTFAASKDENQQTLKGVCINIEQEKIEAIATDRHRLAKYVIHLGSSDDDFLQIERETAQLIVDAEHLKEVAKLKPEIVRVVYSSSEIHFQIGQYGVRSRLIDGNYPDTSKIIPSESSTVVLISTNELLQTLELAQELVREDKRFITKISVTPETFEIYSEHESSSMSESLEAEVSGNDLKLGVNVKYLIDALKSLTTEQVELKFTGAMSPILIHGVGDSRRTHLVLPYRLGSV